MRRKQDKPEAQSRLCLPVPSVRQHSPESSMPADTPIALFTPDTFSPLCSLYFSLPLYFMLSVYVTRPPSFFILALCLSDDVVTQKQEGFVVFYSEALPTSSHFLMRPWVAEQQPIRHVKNQRGGFTSCLFSFFLV